ncbi:hypothetical protein Fmac_028656 [Flemingia macrophylla]|uniref:Uncharacterized protein n=1 Tax=Flemingia macrophylla TaxID=520843 RepID=A0ABD1L846_9FABA
MPMLQESAASVLPMTTKIVFVLLRSNLEWMSILNLMLQTPTIDHHSSRDKALDREDGSQHLAFSARSDAIVIRGFHDVATDTSTETRKLEGKLDTLVNLVSQLAANQNLASFARVYDIRSSNDNYTSLEGKLDALVNLVTQLAANQKHASIARVCGIRSSNDHHIGDCPSSQQSGVDEHPEAYAANTYSRPPQ